MKMEFMIGNAETIDIIIERNWFTGKFTCTANGQIHEINDPLNLGTHFSTKLKKTYTVEVGTSQKQLISIEHARPLFFAGFRPQRYEVTVDGKVVCSYFGY